MSNTDVNKTISTFSFGSSSKFLPSTSSTTSDDASSLFGSAGSALFSKAPTMMLFGDQSKSLFDKPSTIPKSSNLFGVTSGNVSLGKDASIPSLWTSNSLQTAGTFSSFTFGGGLRTSPKKRAEASEAESTSPGDNSENKEEQQPSQKHRIIELADHKINVSPVIASPAYRDSNVSNARPLQLSSFLKSSVASKRPLFAPAAMKRLQNKRSRDSVESTNTELQLSVTNGNANKRSVRRLSNASTSNISPDQLSQCRSLAVSDIPRALNNKAYLSKHFHIYGPLRSVSPKTPTTAIIVFESHEAAKMAKMSGLILRPGTRPVSAKWVLPSNLARRSISNSSDQVENVSSVENEEEVDKKVKTVRQKLFGSISFGSVSNVENEIQSLSELDSSDPETFSNKKNLKDSFLSDGQTTSETIGGRKSQLTEPPERIREQLKALIGKYAPTPYDKYLLLDQRDQIIRKAAKNHAASEGTCMAMCPEKERYMRLYRMQMDPKYEGSDPEKAVKEYVRSAADQHEPLPHELRPSGVLKQTMQYLLCHIIGVGPPADSELAHWFEFLWKTTRAIRKDLTQQRLLNLISVELIEQCTRFHIFCAHWLCEIDIGDFDQKINTENMSKCLQSLEHLYADLGAQGNVLCDNEPEFRSYQILLSLNDTNAFRQALSWNDRVRQAPVVRFALELMTAFHSSNYRRFFALIQRQATYLQACMSHRYFTQMRRTAFRIIMRSYQSNSLFPVEHLVELLGFDSTEECLEFCAQLGLDTLPDDRSQLLLDRSTFDQSGTAAAATVGGSGLKRSMKLVEKKREGFNLNEIVNGGAIDARFCSDLPKYINSFSDDGQYILDPVLKEYGCEDKPVTTSLIPPAAPVIPTTNSNFASTANASLLLSTPFSFLQPNFFNISSQDLTQKHAIAEQQRRQALVNKTEALFEEETCRAEVRRIATDVVASALTARFIMSCIGDFVEETVSSEIETARNKCDKILQECNSLLDSWINDLIRSLTTASWKDQMQPYLEDKSRNICAKLVDEVVAQEIDSVCSGEHLNLVTRVVDRLSTIGQRFKRLKLKAVLRDWRRFAKKHVQRRLLKANFPAAPPTQDSPDVLNMPLRRVPSFGKQKKLEENSTKFETPVVTSSQAQTNSSLMPSTRSSSYFASGSSQRDLLKIDFPAAPPMQDSPAVLSMPFRRVPNFGKRKIMQESSASNWSVAVSPPKSPQMSSVINTTDQLLPSPTLNRLLHDKFEPEYCGNQSSKSDLNNFNDLVKRFRKRIQIEQSESKQTEFLWEKLIEANY